ncbi:MAG: serine hydrolase domain-containing protein [Sphingorhabdus sp.]
MTKIQVILLAAILSFVPGGAMAEPVSNFIQEEMTRHNVPGVAITVIQEGRVVRAQGFGQANIEHNVPVHPDTVFKTGATGTQLTAAVVMLLVEDGKIALDAPVTRYLAKAPKKWEKVTIRQLLNHTSGLPATPNGNFRTDYTNDQLLGIIAAQDLNFPAGSRWRFSYAGYIVLGFVVQEVSGEHWTALMKRRLFGPLGMQSARGIDELEIIPNRAAGYEQRDGNLRNAEWVSSTANSTADGSLYLSALDYAAWAAAVSQRRILNSKSWDELTRPARLNDGKTCAYAPGWFSERAVQIEARWHSGSWQGFQTYALRYPDKDLTVAIFANGEGADVQRLARGVVALVEPSLARPVALPLSDSKPAVTTKVRALLEAIAVGRANYADFTDFARLDFTELTAQYAGMLGEPSSLEDIALFDVRDACAETAYRYRARYKQGLVEIRIGFATNGKVGNLEIVPLNDWNEPL